MSYWNKHPEELDEVTTNCLPEPWKSQVENNEIELSDVPEDIRFKAMDEGTSDYWAEMVSHAMDMHKAEKEDALINACSSAD